MPEEQRLLHITTEILAIPVGVLLIYLGITLQTEQWIRIGLIVIGAGNIIIDGYLLFKWLR